ncbi:hypothetical protein IID20_02835 [Patescibacteria group bacterium]|nr:hypothetical protein [Patescibacteria group bacterium]
MIRWANLLHFYQPPGQKKEIINKVVNESYDKILAILEAQPKAKISLNICASLTEQLVGYGHQEIITRIKKLAQQGQIELVGSAKYHPILPLLSKSEVIRQIKLNENLNQKYFGKIWRPRPKGFFLPELAYNKATARIIQALGYQWIVLDEIAYQGKLGQVLFDHTYEMKDLFPGQGIKKKLKVVFRHRNLSSLFFSSWLDSVDKFFSAIEKDKRSTKFLVTAFDGENLGHHQKHLAELWAKLLADQRIQSINYTEYLDILKSDLIKEIEPLPSSWSTEIKDLENKIPYPLWSDPANKLHQLQWQLTNLVIKIIQTDQDNSNYKKAREKLDQALQSDQYWWASARPWWGPGMIEKGVKRFSEIIQLLKTNINPAIKNKAESLIQNILNELDQRKKSGRYKITQF